MSFPVQRGKKRKQPDPPGYEQGDLQGGGGSDVKPTLERDGLSRRVSTRSKLSASQHSRSIGHTDNSPNTPARNITSSGNTTMTNSNNTVHNTRAYNQAKHNEFQDSTFCAPVRIGDNNYYFPQPGLPIGESNSGTSVYFMVPFPQNLDYIGTSQTIKEQLKGDNTGGHQRLAFWGLGGVGKTQDVLNFVYEFKSPRSRVSRSVFWVHAGSALRFEKDYRMLAALVKLQGWDDPKHDIRPIVKNWFERPDSGDWILVLDNADDKLVLFPEFSPGIQRTIDESMERDGLAQYIPRGSKGTVIVTTRDHDVADLLASTNTLRKEALSPEHAKQLFKRHYPGAAEQEEDDQSISLLLKALQYLPLAIVQVAAFLRQNRLFSPSDYLKRFNSTKDSQKLLLSKPFNDIRSHVCDYISADPGTISASKFLLKMMACVDRQGIPHELLARSGLKGSDDDFFLREAINKLINFSLLTASLDGLIPSFDGFNRAYEMHSLVHVSIYAFLSPQEIKTVREATTKVIAEILPNGEYKNWPVWSVYLPHASALTKGQKAESIEAAVVSYHMSWYFSTTGRYYEAEDAAQTSANQENPRRGVHKPGQVEGGRATFCAGHGDEFEGARPGPSSTLTSIGNLASTFWNQGRWKEAEQLEVQVMETSSRVLGQDHPDTLTSIGNLASTYRNQGRWKEAEQLDVQVMETRKRVLGQDHPDTLTSIGNFASTFWNQGRWKEAEQLDVQVMETSSRVLGPDHPSTLTSIGNLASTFWNQGRWKEAEELFVQVMETRKRVLGQEHPFTLTSMANLASTYRNQGRWKEAEQLDVQVMETRKRVLGPDHPDTLTSIGNFASTFWNQGRWKEAEQLDVQVMETSSRVLGQDHPSTLTSIANLASTYRNQGRWKEAEQLDVQVMETSSRVLGQDHPDTLTSIGNLASTFWNQGRWKEAEQLEVQVMETSTRVLGPDHPSTLTSIGNLASTFWNQGRWKEAEELFVQVMETRKRVLGQEHPFTLTSMANLASTYRNQGRWKEAEELFVQVMETRKRVLGQEHPDTLTSMANLASTFWNQGRWKEAEELFVQVMETRKRVLGQDHPDTLTIMHNLPYTCKSQGHVDKAIGLIEEVATLRSRILGADHPHTKSTMSTLIKSKSEAQAGSN
ncbi:hypothetical protein BDD12DRAFT_902441 [Trichophaea hybrida]|nr:hypothetical protein BDD12DRAFT_902441 [Trichophaea hybrida]